MSHADHQEKRPVDRAAQEAFFAAELHRLSEKNAELAEKRASAAAEIARRQAARRACVMTCMDERCIHVEEALGLLPGEADVYGSGGGRLDMKSFNKLFAPQLQAAAATGALPVVYLVTHFCSAGADLGCAAFKNDIPAQTAFFDAFKKEILAAHPNFVVHVLLHDTAADHLQVHNADERDAALTAILKASAALAPTRPGLAHAGYGVYLGDTYRAWNDGYNRYFSLAAENPELVGNLGIAFAVMAHHSQVDLIKTPIIVHVDYPLYEDAGRTKRLHEKLEENLKEALRAPEAAQLLSDGQIKIVRTETDVKTWKGRSVGEPEFKK